MKLPVSAVLKNLDGTEMTLLERPRTAEDPNPPEQPLTLRIIIQQSVSAQVKGDENMGGDEKFALYNIALKANDPLSDYTIEEAGKIKARIGKVAPPTWVGNAYTMIEAAASQARETAKAEKTEARKRPARGAASGALPGLPPS